MHLKTAMCVLNPVAALQLFLLLNVVNCSIDPDSILQISLKPNPEQSMLQNTEELLKDNDILQPKPSIITEPTKPHPPTTPQELQNVLKLLPIQIRESIRSYIASRLKRVVLIPPTSDTDLAQPHPHSLLGRDARASSTPFDLPNLTFDLTTLTKPSKKLYNPHGKRMLGSHLVPIIPEGAATPKWIPGELIANQISKREIQLINDSMFGPLKSVTMFPSLMSSILVFPRRYHPERLAQILKYNYGVEAEPNGRIEEVN